MQFRSRSPSLLLLALAASQSWAQSQNSELRDQAPRDLDQASQPVQAFNEPGVVPSFSDLLKNLHGSYAVSYMGPRFDGAAGETYNIYLPDVSSVQLYHTAQLGYQVSPDLQIGINEAIAENLVNGVHGLPVNGQAGNTYSKTFDYYDPNIYFNLPHLITVPGWNVFTSASFSLPLNNLSLQQKKITEFIIQQSWSVNNFPSRWSYGVHLYFNPQFYNDPIPDGFTDRQTLSFSFGHSLNYYVSPLFNVGSSSTFYVEHRSPSSHSFVYLGSGLPDYFQFTASITPNVYPRFMSIGGYVQFLTFATSWATSIIGANFKIGF